MTIKTFEKVQNHIQAIRFEGGRDSAMEICRWVGTGSAYIPSTKTDPFEYVQIPTMFGPRDMEVDGWAVKIAEGTFVTYKEEALMAEYTLVEDEEHRLIKHARAELAKFPNEDADFIESIINTVKAFSAYRGHSGSSAAIAIHMVHALLNGENLLPLTNDPAEWQMHPKELYGVEKDMWQNLRNSKAISYDGGATYFIVGANKLLPGTESDADRAEMQMFTSEDVNFVPEIDPEDLKGEDENTFDASYDDGIDSDLGDVHPNETNS